MNLETRQKTGLWLLGILLLAALAGLPELRLNPHYHAYFDPGDPLISLQKRLEAEYTSMDKLLLLLQRQGEMTDGEFLQMTSDITAGVAALDGVEQVYSLQDLPWPGGAQQGLELAMQELEQNGAAGIDLAAVIDHPRGGGLSLSADAGIAVVEVGFVAEALASPAQLLATMATVRGFVAETIAENGWRLSSHYSGTLALNEAYIQTVRHDLRIFVPALLLIFALLLTWFFRSLSAAMSLLLMGLLSVAGAFGLVGWLGLELAAINAFAPVILSSISVAGGVHIVSAYLQGLDATQNPEAAAAVSVAFNRLPLSLTHLTTALGFLGLSFSPSPPLRVVGYVVAMGCVFSYLLNLLVLPRLLARWLRRGRGNLSHRFRIDAIAAAVLAHKSRVLLAAALLAALSLAVLPRNEINDNVFAYFPPQHEFRQDMELLDQYLSGVNVLQYSMAGYGSYAVLQAEYIQDLEAFSAWLLSQPQVRRVDGVNDWIQWRQRNEGLSRAEVLAGYRRLAESDAGRGELLRREIRPDFKASRILVYLQPLSARQIIDFQRRTDQWLAENMDYFFVQGGAGAALTFAHLGIRNALGMMLSLGLALLGIGLLVGLILRSAMAAWAGMICNALPILIAYAGWALVDGRISLGSAVVMGMVMGIVVDDSIYLLSKYAAARRRGEARPVLAALRQVAPALMITSVVLVCGLSVGLWSEFQPIVAMSGLSVAIIALALLTVLTLLPVLLSLGRSSRTDA